MKEGRKPEYAEKTPGDELQILLMCGQDWHVLLKVLICIDHFFMVSLRALTIG